MSSFKCYAGAFLENSGKYQCSARRGQFYAERSEIVQVLNANSQLPAPPTIENLPTDPSRPVISDIRDTSVVLRWNVCVPNALQTQLSTDERMDSSPEIILPSTSRLIPTSAITNYEIEYFSPDWQDDLVSYLQSDSKSEGNQITWKQAKSKRDQKGSEVAWLVEGLHQSTQYYFVVRARNSFGLGPPSPVSFLATTKSSIVQQPFPIYGIFSIIY